MRSERVGVYMQLEGMYNLLLGENYENCEKLLRCCSKDSTF
jgi:hypothetical protein